MDNALIFLLPAHQLPARLLFYQINLLIWVINNFPATVLQYCQKSHQLMEKRLNLLKSYLELVDAQWVVKQPLVLS